MRFYEYIKESLKTVENNELYEVIVDQGYWLFEHKEEGGLGLEEDIDEILDPFMESLLPGEIFKFMHDLNELRRANLITKGQHWFYSNLIKKKKNVKENGKWSIVNKINTNYHVLAFLLTYLIDRMESDPEQIFRDKSAIIRKKIINDPKNGLITLEKVFISLVRRYFPTINTDFTEFKKILEPIIIDTSGIGDKYEGVVAKYFTDLGFDVRFQGGDGDWIDMLLLTDLLVYREDFGFKRVQVKPLNYNKSRKKYIKKNVEWLAKADTHHVEIFDMITLEPIDIKNN